MVGGSMLKWQQTFFQEVKSVTFYKVYMPVGLGVVHEYIGVKAMMTNGSTKLSTSGLVGDADAAYFKNTLPIPVRSKQYVPAFARSMLKD